MAFPRDNEPKDPKSRFQDDESGDDSVPSGGVKGLFLRVIGSIQRNRKRYSLAASVMLIAGFFCFVAWAMVAIIEMRRPTIEMAIDALDYGAYQQAREYAKSVLKYALPEETEKRGAALYVYGVALCEETEGAKMEDKKPFFREAADTLAESRELGFIADRSTDGNFYLGKALYYCQNYPEAVQNLEIALEKGSPRKKTIHWYLANAYFAAPRPDYEKGLEALDRFDDIPPFLEREKQESILLRTFLNLQLERLEAAKASFQTLPRLTNPATMIRSELAAGKICMQEADGFFRHADTLAATSQLSVPKEERDKLEKQLQETPLREIDATIISPREVSASPFLRRLEYERELARNLATSTPSSPTDALRENDQDAEELAANEEPEENRGPVLEPVGRSQTPTSKDIIINTWRHLAMQKLQDAITHFENVKHGDRNLLEPYRQAMFLKAMSLEQLGEYDQSQEEYYSLARTFPGTSEAIAAQFRWGYIEYTIRNRPDTGYASLNRFFEMLNEHDSYNNSWMNLDDIAEIGITEVENLIQRKEYDKAAELFAYFLSIVPEERQARIFTRIYQLWGEQLENLAEDQKIAEKNKLLRQAREKFRLAAHWYEVLAKWTFDSSGYLGNVWTAAEYYEKVRDFPKALAMYRLYLEHDLILRQAQSHYHIGSIFFEMNEVDAAVKELQYCIESFPDDPMIEQTRLVLAYALQEKMQWDAAAQLLKANLDGKYNPQSEVYRQSLYELGRVYSRMRDSTEAIRVFEDVLALYPDDPRTAEAHYMIAKANMDYETELDARMVEALLQSQKDSIRQTLAETRQQALTNLQQARTFLLQQEERDGLNIAEQRMLRNTFFMIGRLLTAMGPEYYEAADRENKAAITRYFAHPDVLQAYLQLAGVSQLQGQLEQADNTMQQARNLLKRFQSANAFRQETVYSEKQWQELLGTP